MSELERLYAEYWSACRALHNRQRAKRQRIYFLRYRRGTAAMIADLIERGVA